MKGFIEVKRITSHIDGEVETLLINVNCIQMVDDYFLVLNFEIERNDNTIECVESYEEIKKLIEEAVE